MIVLTQIEVRGIEMYMKGSKGFTLIELLVVIAIIALLMSILLPALSKVKDQAKSSVCMSNMRQIGIAANLYCEDWEQRIPRGTGGEISPWYQVFMPYLSQRPMNNDYRNVKIYRCPSYPDRQQTVCFVVNGWDFRGPDDMNGYEQGDATKLTQCVRRSETIYLGDNEYGRWRDIIRRSDDEGVRRCDVWHPGHMPNSDTDDLSHGRRVARKRHKDGSNYLFLDWHVEYISTEDMTIDLWRFHMAGE
jgi:prepilin-type N-terminal cleavage/methylation domain-containing protein/prepilin-type processing-associated H-X9-DG protein